MFAWKKTDLLVWRLCLEEILKIRQIKAYFHLASLFRGFSFITLNWNKQIVPLLRIYALFTLQKRILNPVKYLRWNV